MAAATAQGTYINPMAALATQIPHATLNGMANSVVPPTSGNHFSALQSGLVLVLVFAHTNYSIYTVDIVLVSLLTHWPVPSLHYTSLWTVTFLDVCSYWYLYIQSCYSCRPRWQVVSGHAVSTHEFYLLISRINYNKKKLHLIYKCLASNNCKQNFELCLRIWLRNISILVLNIY